MTLSLIIYRFHQKGVKYRRCEKRVACGRAAKHIYTFNSQFTANNRTGPSAVYALNKFIDDAVGVVFGHLAGADFSVAAAAVFEHQ